ncbi:MAG: GNAT family N-acetyltransferase [Actinobacteria bacterium]|nr:GNAT family N-acetyltransferase [Actinomycetota bacterium]
MTGDPADGVVVRPMEDADVGEVVELLTEALGPGPGGVDRRALFEWKHLGNPFGRSLALVAELDGRIVGLRSLMRWRLAGAGGTLVHAVRAVDTATSPAVQRRGVFTRLTREALEACAREDVALVFNTPNARSLPGYLKLGWREVARWPVRIRVRRPLHLARAAARRDLAPGAPVAPPDLPVSGPGGAVLVPAVGALSSPALDRLLGEAVVPEGGLHTPRNALYLRWRFSAGPIPYQGVLVGDPPEALVVLRLRARGRLREAVVCEVLATPRATGLPGVLRALPGMAGADHAVAHAGPGWPAARALGRGGYRKVPRAGLLFTVRPVPGRAVHPDPLDPASWSLSLGDLEVF